MASTKIRGATQIMDATVDIGRLEVDFLNGSDWDITNGNQDAGIRGVRLTPLNSDELASKYYVDSVASGLDWKDSCQLTTKADIGGSYSPSGGTGGTGAFTGVDLTSIGIFDLGSHTAVVGDRILVKDQTDAKQNGIYVVTTAGSSGAIERSSDQDGNPGNEVSGGNATFIENGSTYAKTGWVLQGDGILSINTDNLVWVQFSGSGTYTAGNGLVLTGNVFSADYAGSGGSYGTATTLARSDHDHDGDYAANAFVTMSTPLGTSPVADAYNDTLNFTTTSNVITITGNAASDTIDFDIATDSINDTHIDWGSGANQVNATDVPLDTGGTWSGIATNVQDALEELEGSSSKFVTIATDHGTSPVADTVNDTLTLKSSSGVIVVTGNATADSVDFDIAADGIKDTHIDWGTGADQVSAEDMPTNTSSFNGVLSSADDTVQKALDTLDDHNHDGDYAQNAFTTINAPSGTNPVADSATDTLNLASGGPITITGDSATDTVTFDIGANGIKDTHIDWGTGAGQVSGGDVPLADSGNYFTTDDVESALQELAAATPGIGYTEVWDEYPAVTHQSAVVTLAHTPTSASEVRVFLNGVLQKQGSSADYTISGTTITFTFNLLSTPGQSDSVCVMYKY